MILSRSFGLRLLAYLRQAAASLHRAPAVFSKAMHDYYEACALPSPARVIAGIDAATEVRTPASEWMARTFGHSIAFSQSDLNAIRDSLRALENVLEMRAVESEAEKVRIRLVLSNVEELLRRKLGRRSRQVENVEHLNESPGLGLRPLGELVGRGWPEST